MPTKKLKKHHKQFFKALGRFIERKILDDLEYKSLDQFALSHYDRVTKKTLYALCKGERDIKLSTLLGLATALQIEPHVLLKEIQFKVY